MRLLGFEIARVKAQAQNLQAVHSASGWFGLIRESFSGAFQQHIEVDAPRNVVAFSAVFACVTIIASDIAKLRIKLMKGATDGFRDEVTTGSPFLPVLSKPNKFQNRIKFIEQWIVSKLLHGNAYAIKVRDQRGIVTDLYLLDAAKVLPLVADNGDVYYQIGKDNMAGGQMAVVVPASEIIHDMMVSLWHPLVGISPIYACGLSATMGNRIQGNSVKFFNNMSRPSGMLSAPGNINDDTAGRLKKAWEENFGGSNIGRLAVLGDGLKYEAMTISAGDAQLIEQLKWTVEDVARCFHVPLYKLGAESGQQAGTRLSIEALNQAYYSDCLQALIESLEMCLDEGLSLPNAGYSSELDLDGLLRMDTAARFAAKGTAVKDGWMAPDEARLTENLRPVPGGRYPYLQQQNYSLEALAKRDALADPFSNTASTTSTADPSAPVPDAATQAANDAQAAAEAAAKVLIDIQRVVAEQETAARLRIEAEQIASRERAVAAEKAIAEREEATRLRRETEANNAQAEAAMASIFIKGLEEYEPA